MILYPPVQFNENEWFLIGVAILNLLVLWLLPARLPAAVTLMIFLYNIYLGQTADYILGLPPYDLYDVNDRPAYEWFDAITYSLVYTPAAYVAV